jgi:hypothetical protein
MHLASEVACPRHLPSCRGDAASVGSLETPVATSFVGGVFTVPSPQPRVSVSPMARRWVLRFWTEAKGKLRSLQSF